MFEQVVFAGGGNRCWWQAGFWETVAPALAMRPRVIAGVSAGAATACLLYANDARTALAYYREALAGNRRNVYPLNLLRRGRPVFPHNAIYRKALQTLLGGEHFERLMRTAPEIRVQFARIPRWLGPRSAVAFGIVGYNVEKYVRRSLHPGFGRAVGFRSEVARVQDCRDADELVSLIIASSCTPPFTPIEYRGGRPTMDGGLVDNVPVDAVDRDGGPTLVLTTRRYPRHTPVFVRAGRIYVQPSRQVAASSWDYTSPDTYEQTWRQGCEDGEAFLRGFPALRGGAGPLEGAGSPA
ncbi:MAG: patatin-like phospholipase family protein [Burkholderiaceae bacterium]|nr:patatin-like phospholipase family protein [Burkholderiaceae bacterium]